ncbi:hypothetical protein SVAN01_01164 [Stagonosporopsis vannaccii]|nr:hypothetical protein SVAN01_01164 [Stagonosporopsis vannaccii]
MAAKPKSESKGSEQNGVSEEEVRNESSKVAKQATEAHDKATELMKAAAAAGDPEERQRLMEQALEQQIQSGSLGKTAKYLRSGTFQGMAVGAGLGIAPGASLGTITGTLVGGVTSTALGGLGAGLGAATGALHGPFWDLKKGAGKGIQHITGNLPGWTATESQKQQLEKMVGQINEQDAPRKDELESWGSESVSADQQQALDKAQSKLPSMPSMRGSRSLSKQGEPSQKQKEKKDHDPDRSKPGKFAAAPDERVHKEKEGTKNDQEDKPETERRQDKDEMPEEVPNERVKSIDTRSAYKDVAVQTEQEGRKKPRKLQTRSSNGNKTEESKVSQRQPRKLEKRSA